MKFSWNEGQSTFGIMARKALTAGMIVSQGILGAQQLYDNQENVSHVNYVTRPEGRVAVFTANPKSDSVNGSGRCAKFTRNRQRYDYIKIVPQSKLQDVSAYASYDDNAPRIRMKVFTTAPAGSMVEVQLGKQQGNAYPEGTHSQYQAVTTKSGEWEELEFRFVQTPKGSQTGAREVDQITLLFMPNTSAMQTFYFDEIQGPPLNENTSAKASKRK